MNRVNEESGLGIIVFLDSLDNIADIPNSFLTVEVILSILSTTTSDPPVILHQFQFAQFPIETTSSPYKKSQKYPQPWTLVHLSTLPRMMIRQATGFIP